MIRYSCHSENFGLYSPEDTFALILFLSSVELNQVPIPPAAPQAQTDEFFRSFDRICSFAEKAGFQSIMGSAGKNDLYLGFSMTFERTARTLQKQSEIAQNHGLAFHVEPSRQSLLHSVSAALDMVQAAPGLRYTLDFLHYHVQCIPLSESLKLIPYAGHLHARQARAHTGKCDFSLGDLDYSAIISQLKLQNWSGDIAMEFWCSPQMLMEGIDPVEQNILMRYTLKKLFQ